MKRKWENVKKNEGMRTSATRNAKLSLMLALNPRFDPWWRSSWKREVTLQRSKELIATYDRQVDGPFFDSSNFPTTAIFSPGSRVGWPSLITRKSIRHEPDYALRLRRVFAHPGLGVIFYSLLVIVIFSSIINNSVIFSFNKRIKRSQINQLCSKGKKNTEKIIVSRT